MSHERRNRRINRRQALRLGSGALLALGPLRSFANVYLTPQQARSVIFPGESFTRVEVNLTPLQTRDIQRRSGVRVREARPEAWRSEAGNVVFIDRILGKHEFIDYACGITAACAVRQIEILEYRETYGDEIRDDRWRRQFVGKRAADPLKLDKDILNISGATLSCSHVTDGVRRLLATFELVFCDAAASAAVARHAGRDRSIV